MLSTAARRDLVVAVSLAAVAGMLDAIGFVALVGVFTANQSGNAIELGIAIGRADGWRALRLLTSMVAFSAGVAFGVLVRRRRLPLGRAVPNPVGPVLTVELALLLLVLLVTLPASGVSLTEPASGPSWYLLTVLAALAMGMQTVVIRHVAEVNVSTTYVSGGVAALGEATAEAALGQERPARRTIVVIGSVLVAYVGGAALGAATREAIEAWSLLIPLGLTSAVLATEARRRRPQDA